MYDIRMWFMLGGWLLLTAHTSSVEANLLVNPSFEANSLLGLPGTFQYILSSSVPGWNTFVEFGSFKIGKGGAQDGSNFLFLDSYVAGIDDSVYQDVMTKPGKVYDLSFYMKRGIYDWFPLESQKAAIVDWNGVAIDASGYTVPDDSWLQIQLTVTGTGGSDRLTMRESTDLLGRYDGPYIDKVELTEAAGQFGGGGGDPHFKTWTGLRYDYHGECDLVFLQNPGFDNGQGLYIYMRTVRQGYYSYIERVALQVGNDVLEYAGVNEWYKNGIESSKKPNQKNFQAKQKFGKYRLRTHSRALSLRIDEKRKIKIDFTQRRNGFLYIVVDGKSTDIFKGSLGMIGQYGTGEMVARDGTTVISDPNLMAQEWQVRDTDPKLFLTSRDPQYPVSCTAPKKTLGDRLGSSAMRRRAEKVCSNRSDEVSECIFDVMATRDIGAAAF